MSNNKTCLSILEQDNNFLEIILIFKNNGNLFISHGIFNRSV